MAEFCLKCWNKINGTDKPEYEYVMSKEIDFCEECWELKRVVIKERESYDIIGRFFSRLRR